MLKYLTPQPHKAPVTELEHAVAIERGGWIRRRLLIYASIALVLQMGGLVVTVTLGATSSPIFAQLDSAVSIVVLVTALVVAYRSSPHYHRILRIAVALFLFISAMNLVSTRLTLFTLQDEIFHIMMASSEQGANAARTDNARMSKIAAAPADGVGIAAASRPVERLTPRVATRVYFGFVWTLLLGTLLYNHLLASFFIPWTWRDTLRPAAALLALYGVGLIVDAQTHDVTPLLWAPLVIASPLAFLPGSVLCWWRYSRFNKRFRLQFESRGYRALQSELDGARRIHEACLPQQLRDGPVRIGFAYQPMRHIGGDLLFVHPSPQQPAPERLFVLLDVMGHGIAAALTVNRIVGELERVVSEHPDISPAGLLTTLNRYANFTLARHSIFLSGLAVRVRPEAGTLTYANAGHPMPVLCRIDGTTETPDSTAMLLGVAPAADFDCEEIVFPFGPGDRFVAYTDGALDAKNAAGRPLGSAGIFELIKQVHAARTPQHHAARAVLDAIRSHRGGLPEDDVLVVAVSLG